MSHILCSLWNVRSLNNKFQDVMEHILDRNPDIVFITETWMASENNNTTAMIKSYGYVLHHKIRKERDKVKGGGLGIMLKQSIMHKELPNKQFQSFEHVCVKIMVAKRSLILICIYRIIFVSHTTFLDEFMVLLETKVSTGCSYIIAGDVNIHLDTKGLYSKSFKELLDALNLTQNVKEPTHKMGRILDVVINKPDEILVYMLAVTNLDLSSHLLIDFKLEQKIEKTHTTQSHTGI
nr:uncharacterized protein LOC124812737 [Hydra vulgaris]